MSLLGSLANEAVQARGPGQSLALFISGARRYPLLQQRVPVSVGLAFDHSGLMSDPVVGTCPDPL
jgi:hypothetical protein